MQRSTGNRPAWKQWLSRLNGSTIRADLRRYQPVVEAIAQLESAFRDLSDKEILRRSQALHESARAGEPLAALRTPLYALAREASRRALGHRLFDEQVVAALALDDGCIVEMQTGEGKTLAGTWCTVPSTGRSWTRRTH